MKKYIVIDVEDLNKYIGKGPRNVLRSLLALIEVGRSQGRLPAVQEFVVNPAVLSTGPAYVPVYMRNGSSAAAVLSELPTEATAEHFFVNYSNDQKSNTVRLFVTHNPTNALVWETTFPAIFHIDSDYRETFWKIPQYVQQVEAKAIAMGLLREPEGIGDE